MNSDAIKADAFIAPVMQLVRGKKNEEVFPNVCKNGYYLLR